MYKILQNPINDSIECLFLDKNEPDDDKVENLFFLVVALELTGLSLLSGCNDLLDVCKKDVLFSK